MFMKLAFFLSAILSFHFIAAQDSPTIDQFMSADEQQKTGVNTLSDQQKQALAEWLSMQLSPEKPPAQTGKSLHLSENIGQGKLLVLSDGSRWEVDPDDISVSSLWLFPIKVEVQKSKNQKYPSIIKNLNSGSQVHARKIKRQNSG